MLTDRTDDKTIGKYPVGSISFDLLMKAAHLLHPGPFMLYVALLVRCAGKTECWPAMNDLATSLHTQIGAIKLWREQLKKTNLLDLRIGPDGLEHYIVKLPGAGQQRSQREQDRLRTRELSAERAAERAEIERSKVDVQDTELTRNLFDKVYARSRDKR